jgi:hypothetical protein
METIASNEEVRFVDASTTVAIPRSQWFDLGGMSNLSESNKDVLGTILSTGDSGKKSSFLVKIKADVNNEGFTQK